jgi:hypothetical protein
MAGVSDNFPIHQWHELVPQIVLTLNLVQQSHVAPNVSAYTYNHGHFNYNHMPLAPMGCAVQFHIKPNRRKIWGEHSSDKWYLTTSPDHYRCHLWKGYRRKGAWEINGADILLPYIVRKVRFFAWVIGGLLLEGKIPFPQQPQQFCLPCTLHSK